VLIVVDQRVDALFKVEQFLGVFCCPTLMRNSVKMGVVDGCVVLQHAMDGVQPFSLTLQK
jgi:hypothetical protein